VLSQSCTCWLHSDDVTLCCSCSTGTEASRTERDAIDSDTWVTGASYIHPQGRRSSGFADSRISKQDWGYYGCIRAFRYVEEFAVCLPRCCVNDFPTTTCRWSAYVTPKSPKAWLKKRFYCFVKIKSNFSQIKC